MASDRRGPSHRDMGGGYRPYREVFATRVRQSSSRRDLAHPVQTNQRQTGK